MKVIVTEKLITHGQSFRGGWNRRQFEILGFEWPPQKGWRRLAVGREIDQQDAVEFVSLGAQRPREASVP